MRPMLSCFLFISDSYYTFTSKGKLKAAFPKRMNGSTPGELNFCEGEPVGLQSDEPPQKKETGRLM